MAKNNDFINSTGSKIRSARLAKGFTQEQLAERLHVTFQAVSSWERDVYFPEVNQLMELSRTLDVSVSYLLEPKTNYHFTTTKEIFNWEHQKSFIKTVAKANKWKETLWAIDFACRAHEGVSKKGAPEVPYIYHPLSVACHAIAMDIDDDHIIAACLLHDTLEDSAIASDGEVHAREQIDNSESLEYKRELKKSDFEVSAETFKLIQLMTHDKTTAANRDEVMSKYFKELSKNPKASLIKCLDRCNNLTTMVYGLTKERMYRMIDETEKYFPALLKTIKKTPEYNNYYWLLSYQMLSMLDIYKRLL